MPKSKGRPAYTVRSSSQAAKDREGGSAPSIGDPAPLSLHLNKNTYNLDTQYLVMPMFFFFMNNSLLSS
jgi:hypothetical protein